MTKPARYTKVYTRENTLFSIQVWEEHQGRRLKKIFGKGTPPSILYAREGVVLVYYDENIGDVWGGIIEQTINTNPKLIEDLMDLYEKQIVELEEVWKRKEFATKKELVDFFDFMADMWIGLSISYCLPETKGISQKYQDLGMMLRQRSVDFLDATDKVIYRSLLKFFPQLGDLVKYLTIEEISTEKIPPVDVLTKRKKNYMYFEFKLFVDVPDHHSFAKAHGIELIEDEIPKVVTELKGQTAMKGKVTGPVRILHNKSMIGSLKHGEILVTAMTTPDYLPAMDKAVAFITDEGGITCHAAIVAREMKKPCVIGTRIATQVLKNGDMVEVDATKGIVKILK